MEPLFNNKNEGDVGLVIGDPDHDGRWRRHCGCLRTSDKLRQILDTFPSPPPPSPRKCEDSCVVAYCPQIKRPQVLPTLPSALINTNPEPFKEPCGVNDQQVNSKPWRVVFELVQLVQLSVTATALALYYLIYCYMQLVYYTLRSALYFHHADGPMKVTIGVVTLTSLIVGFNVIMRIERIIKIT